MKEIMPCVDCVVMAMCNARMHRSEKKLGMNAWEVYKRCSSIKDYVDANHVTQIDQSTWKTSLMCIQVFFMGVDYTNPYIMSDAPRRK